MIQIEDDDLPITAAQKIITGVKPSNANPIMRKVIEGLAGVESEEQTIDMFTLEEIREIGLYLETYYKTHEVNDD